MNDPLEHFDVVTPVNNPDVRIQISACDLPPVSRIQSKPIRGDFFRYITCSLVVPRLLGDADRHPVTSVGNAIQSVTVPNVMHHMRDPSTDPNVEVKNYQFM